MSAHAKHFGFTEDVFLEDELERARVVDVLDANFTHQQLALWANGWAFIGDRLDKPTVTVSGQETPAAARAAAAKKMQGTDGVDDSLVRCARCRNLVIIGNPCSVCQSEIAKLEAYDGIEAMVLASEDEELEPGEVWERVAKALRESRTRQAQLEQREARQMLLPEEPSGWALAADELPDTDTLVLATHAGDSDCENSELVLLEISDDSEGHGEPHWATVRGEPLPFDTFTHWRPLPSPPVKETP